MITLCCVSTASNYNGNRGLHDDRRGWRLLNGGCRRPRRPWSSWSSRNSRNGRRCGHGYAHRQALRKQDQELSQGSSMATDRCQGQAAQ